MLYEQRKTNKLKAWKLPNNILLLIIFSPTFESHTVPKIHISVNPRKGGGAVGRLGWPLQKFPQFLYYFFMVTLNDSHLSNYEYMHIQYS